VPELGVAELRGGVVIAVARRLRHGHQYGLPDLSLSLPVVFLVPSSARFARFELGLGPGAGLRSLAVEDTWSWRDLPVLDAAVGQLEEISGIGRLLEVADIVRVTGLAAGCRLGGAGAGR
jgi:hypothetical protein